MMIWSVNCPYLVMTKYLLSGKVLSSGEVQVIRKEELEEALVSNSNLTFEYMRWSSTQM